VVQTRYLRICRKSGVAWKGNRAATNSNRLLLRGVSASASTRPTSLSDAATRGCRPYQAVPAVLRTRSVLPSHAERLAQQVIRVRALARAVLIRPALVEIGQVHIALLVDAHPVDAVGRTGKQALTAPGVLQVAVGVVANDPVRTLVGGPHLPLGEVDRVDRGLLLADLAGAGLPHVQELAVLVEHLDAAVAAVVDVDAPRRRVDRDAVHDVEVARTRLHSVDLAALAPLHQVVAVLVELHDTRVVVAVSEEHRPVRQPREERRTVEVR